MPGRRINIVCYVLLLSLCMRWPVTGQTFVADVQDYTPEQGLPHREVLSLHRDSRGFIWLGTKKGLSRFDGYGFRNFNQDTDSLAAAEIWDIQEDSAGFFWLLPFPPFRDIPLWHPGTRRQSSLKQEIPLLPRMPETNVHDWYFFPEGATFAAVHTADTAYLACWQNRRFRRIRTPGIRHLQLIRADRSIWAVADSNRLVELDRNGKLLRTHSRGAGMLHVNISAQPQSPRFIFKDEKGTWLRDETGAIRRLPGDFRSPALLPGADVPALGEDLILDNNRIYRLDGSLVLDLEPDWLFIGNLYYRCALFDQLGNLWLGKNFGLTKVALRRNKFTQYLWKDPAILKKGFSTRGILPKGDELYYCAEAKGFFRLDLSSGSTEKILASGPHYNNFYALAQLRDGNLVVGHQDALTILDGQGRPLETLPVPAAVLSVHPHSENLAWLGTDRGIYRLDLADRKLTPLRPAGDFAGLSHAAVYSFRTLRDGRVGLATSTGFYVLEADFTPAFRFSRQGSGPFYIPHDDVLHFHEDWNGDIWLGTNGQGLVWLPYGRVSRPREQPHQVAPPEAFRLANTPNSLDDVVYAVYPEGNDHLWLSTNNGILRFDKKSGAVRRYSEQDGITYREFNKISHVRDDRGILYFGGLNGITAFHPGQLAEARDTTDLPLVVTHFRKFSADGKQQEEDGSDLFRHSGIVLDPADRLVELDLALLSYSQVQYISYHWKLEGLDEDWNQTDEQTLRIGRLPFGDYRLRIRAKDGGGLWSSSTWDIPVRVLRPFYLQAWFLLGCIALLLLGIWGYIRYRTVLLRRQRDSLQAEVDRRTRTIEQQAAALRSLDQLKTRFFTNISHELRTPLSLLLGPADSLLQQPHWPDKERRLLGFIRQNIGHLLNLVNEILDLAKLEDGRVEVRDEVLDLALFFRRLHAQFSSAADSQSVRLRLEYLADPTLHIRVDRGKLEKIIHNFLANALKFTPEGKIVLLRVEETPGDLVIRVTDEGPGIHPDDLPQVFDRFFQSKRDGYAVEGGTGIGLSICRELANLLGGEVGAESRVGSGSTFFLRLPKQPVTPVVTPSEAADGAEVATPLPHVLTTPPPAGPAEPGSADRQQVLMVEDNADLRAYIRLLLAEDYQVTEARNGREAWQLIEGGFRPDLILSDLMMPEMDGMELLEKVKGKDGWRQVPFLLLTARSDADIRLRALRTGVDDYLTKPFLEQELLVRIEKLLELGRERTAARQLSESDPAGGLEIPEAGLSDSDTAWLEEVEALFRRNISNPHFSVEEAARELYLSDRHLTRRMKLLVGLTPNLYLRELRLVHARDLLVRGEVRTVKEACVVVGFQKTQHFSRLFQERFGVGPAHYL